MPNMILEGHSMPILGRRFDFGPTVFVVHQIGMQILQFENIAMLDLGSSAYCMLIGLEAACQCDCAAKSANDLKISC